LGLLGAGFNAPAQPERKQYNPRLTVYVFGAKGQFAPFVVYGDGASPARCRLEQPRKDAHLNWVGDHLDRREDRCAAETLRSWLRQAERTGVGGPG